MEYFSLSNILFFGGLFLICVFTTISGIGGGGIFIPLLMFVKNFTLLESIPLAITIILADCLVRILFLFKLPNPEEPKRYLMDLTISNIIIPFDAVFSWVGVILLKIFPNLITINLIIILIIISLYKIIKTINQEYKKKNIIEEEPIEIDGIEIYFEYNTKNNELIEDRYKNLFLIILSVILVGIFGLKDYFVKCSLPYWMMIMGNIISLSLLCLLSGFFIIRQYKKRKELNFPFISSDIKWNKRNVMKLGILSSLSGILSTWLGLGGSSLITPILYSYQMKAEVIGVSIGISTLFSSLISLINYIFNGSYMYYWGLSFFITSILGSLLGIYLLKIIIRKQKRGIISVLVVMVLIVSVIGLITNIIFSDKGISFEFNKFC